MIEVFNHVPMRFMPPTGTQPYEFLKLLSDGLEHESRSINRYLGYCPRSARQRLCNHEHGFWNVLNLAGEGKKGIYKLDPRHFTGNEEDDLAARKERELEFVFDSRKRAEMETHRLPRALAREIETQQHQFNFESVPPIAVRSNTKKITSNDALEKLL